VGVVVVCVQVFAARQPLELETSYAKDKRIVLRDVLRTDRNFHYFRYTLSLYIPPVLYYHCI
jgi:hypothetical protein